jgi:hypothetical protein
MGRFKWPSDKTNRHLPYRNLRLFGSFVVNIRFPLFSERGFSRTVLFLPFSVALEDSGTIQRAGIDRPRY